MIVLQAAIAGALTGGLFAVMAVGLSLTWGMLRVINLAHFGLILLGAYLTFQLATDLAIDPILTLVITVPLLFIAGAAMQYAFDRLALGEFNSLIVSFGLLIIVVQVGSQLIGLLVDAVSDILTVTDEEMLPPPDVASDMAKRFVCGLLAIDGRMISILSVDNILPEREDGEAQ